METQNSPTPILLRFPDEILNIILELLAPQSLSGELITIDHRSSLSVESFASEPSHTSEEHLHVTGTFVLYPVIALPDYLLTYVKRLICKKFELWTLSRQFARISIRFSPEGFEKLGFLVERPHIAKHVKKFSYMVPSFSSLGNQTLVVVLPL